jgi:hypothetical protein
MLNCDQGQFFIPGESDDCALRDPVEN